MVKIKMILYTWFIMKYMKKLHEVRKIVFPLQSEVFVDLSLYTALCQLD